MNRHLITTLAVAIATIATFAQDASAGGRGGGNHQGGHHRSHNSHRVTRNLHHTVRPVTVVRNLHHPVTVVHPPVQVVHPPVVAPGPTFPTVPAGSTLTIPGNFLGNEPGSVFMVFHNIKLPIQINAWNITSVTVTLPPMAVRDTVLVRLDIILPDGRMGHSQKLNVTAPAPVVLHGVAPALPLPTTAAMGTPPNLSIGLAGN